VRVLLVHPSTLVYSRVFLRLEPLGLELVAQALRQAGHKVHLVDFQVESQDDFEREMKGWQPEVVAISCNYLANVPEVIDLVKTVKQLAPSSFVFIGGHSASYIAENLLEHAEGALDCVLTGEGELGSVRLLEAVEHDRSSIHLVPGVVSQLGKGSPPAFVSSLDDLRPARDLLHHPRRYFIGALDPTASIEFSRGCPWDCAFCSAWTFYGRSYRLVSPEIAVENLASIREPGVFIVDDVAFLQQDHAMAIAEGIARKGIKKQYFAETRCDVLLRNKEVFRVWRKLGLEYLFLGLEAIDAESLTQHRKRTSLDKNMEALEFARTLGVALSINLIADPSWDHQRFELIRKWATEIPEIVNISVLTPYPGTEIWLSDIRRLSTRDYRLFDIAHAVLPTNLPLSEFYTEMVDTQGLIYKKFLGLSGLMWVFPHALNLLLHGQTNFLTHLWSYPKVINPQNLLADHHQPVKFEIRLPDRSENSASTKPPFVHHSRGRLTRSLDPDSEKFVEETSSSKPE
jgi:hopanoid C-3 methylase HpnR